MCTVGCQTLFDFVNNQVNSYFWTSIYLSHALYKNCKSFLLWKQIDGTYMFNLEGLIPKLCQLVQDLGQNESARGLSAAGLQALSSLVLSLFKIIGSGCRVVSLPAPPPNYQNSITTHFLVLLLKLWTFIREVILLYNVFPFLFWEYTILVGRSNKTVDISRLFNIPRDGSMLREWEGQFIHFQKVCNYTCFLI